MIIVGPTLDPPDVMPIVTHVNIDEDFIKNVCTVAACIYRDTRRYPAFGVITASELEQIQRLATWRDTMRYTMPDGWKVRNTVLEEAATVAASEVANGRAHDVAKRIRDLKMTDTTMLRQIFGWPIVIAQEVPNV